MASGTTPELFVHVGLAKTGSTAIQLYLYRARQEFAKHGVYWAETYPNGLYELNDCAHHVYSHKWGGWLDPSKFPVTPDEAWRSLREAIEAKGGRHVISSERFGDLLGVPAGEPVLNFIKETAGPARVRLIGYVRRQDDLIESHIRELIKGGHLKIGIEKYLERVPTFLYYDKAFAQAANILGKENVIVRVYGRGRFVGGDAVSDFLHACDIPGLGERSREGEIINPSLNTLTTKILSDPRIIENFEGRPNRSFVVRKFFNQERHSWLDKYVLIDSGVRRAVMERFKAGNDRLAEMFLSEPDAKALKFDETVSQVTIPNGEFVLTYEDLVELILALQPPPPKPGPAPA
jgi:hypothetical protein